MQIIQIINSPTSIDFEDDNIKRISEKVIYTILDNCSGTTYFNVPSTINVIKLQEKIPLSNLYNTALSHVEDSFFTISTDINFISLEDIDNMLSLVAEHPNAKINDIADELKKDLAEEGCFSIQAGKDEWGCKTYVREREIVLWKN